MSRRTPGARDLAMDPQDPHVLYAGMWQFRRQPWFFTSGGPKSGLYRIDGRRRDLGAAGARACPQGDLGRIAIAVSPAKPAVVFATVEAKKTMLYRSDDRGDTWVGAERLEHCVTSRPFYFSRLVADPKNPDRLYKMGTQRRRVSDDGGKTFAARLRAFGQATTATCTTSWINPKNPEDVIIGTDGGVYISHNRGTTFRFVGSLPVSQFYHVSYDMAWPYNVYGGLQDNSTWYGPSRRAGRHRQQALELAHRRRRLLGVPRSVGPGRRLQRVPGRQPVPHPQVDPRGARTSSRRRSAGEPKYRFNWNTPIHMSPNDPGTIYYASQFLFRSRDRGESWERISPDLTTNDPAKQKQNESGGLTLDNSTAENHCTIFAIAESPKNRNVIWVGTDDGNLQVTRDGGKTWTQRRGQRARRCQPRTWVSSIEAEPPRGRHGVRRRSTVT